MSERTWAEVIGRKLSGVAILALAAGAMSCGGSKKPATALLTPTVTVPSILHASQNILSSSSFIVEPGQYKSFKIEVKKGMTKPIVQGAFNATGGKNDVEVFLLEENQFLNWQNNLKADSAYSSGRVTAGKLKIPLPEEPGTYYVIFSNRFSYITNKAVTADISLEYDHQS